MLHVFSDCALLSFSEWEYSVKCHAASPARRCLGACGHGPRRILHPTIDARTEKKEWLQVAMSPSSSARYLARDDRVPSPTHVSAANRQSLRNRIVGHSVACPYPERHAACPFRSTTQVPRYLEYVFMVPSCGKASDGREK